MIFDRQVLPISKSPGGRCASSYMQFFTTFIPLNVIASLLAVLAAGAFSGGEWAPSAATNVPICAVAAGNGCLSGADRGATPEFSQHVVRATCLAAAPTKQFGFLMLVILVAGAVAELLLLPAILAGPLGRAFKPVAAISSAEGGGANAGHDRAARLRDGSGAMGGGCHN